MDRWAEVVYEDHRMLVVEAGALEAALTMDMGPQDRRVVFSWSIRTLWVALELHLRKEAETFFPVLSRLLGEDTHALTLLKQQHQELRASHRRLAELLQVHETVDNPEMKAGVQEFIDLLDDHEKKTEHLLLDVLEFTLKPKELRALAHAFEQVAQRAHQEEGWPEIRWWVRDRPEQSREKTDMRRIAALGIIGIIGFVFPYTSALAAPVREKAVLTYAPEVPPPIIRKGPAVVEVYLDSGAQIMEVSPNAKYKFWTFNGHVPGPFIRTRVGDILEMHVTNGDKSGMPHNVDLHAVTGPGGGATVLNVVEGEEKVAYFKLLHPWLFIYHCAAPPVMDHIANGMYGLILVEPKKGLPKVDREFYVLQSEVYTKEPVEGQELLEYSHEEGVKEHPHFVVFNGRAGSMIGDNALKAKTGEKIRIYFGNAGPNLISSFHVIGEIFDNVYREADLVDPPAHSIQTTLVPAGGATVVEFGLEVPGNYTLVDHAIFRVEKGAVGFLQVDGKPRHDIYVSKDEADPCEGCLVHP